jgi:hypothetical protein
MAALNTARAASIRLPACSKALDALIVFRPQLDLEEVAYVGVVGVSGRFRREAHVLCHCRRLRLGGRKSIAQHVAGRASRQTAGIVKVAAPDESGVPVVPTNEPPRAILGVLFADLAVG